MGRGPPAGPGGAGLPSGAAAAGGHCQGASGGSERRAGGSVATAAAAAATAAVAEAHGSAPPLPPPLAPAALVSQPPAARVAQPAMSLGGASERSVPATKIEITVSCRNLLDLDTFSKSDPMVVLYTQSRASQEWREFGRTEVIDNTLNPDFVRKFVLDYFFEEKQNLRFDVYNVDSKTNISKPVSKHFLEGWRSAQEVLGCVKRPLELLVTLDQTPSSSGLQPTLLLPLLLPECPACAPHSLFLFLLGCHCWDLQKDFLGQAFLALGEVIGGQGSRVERTLTGVPGKKCGTILLTAEELSNCRDIATMQLCANKLDKKDFFGKSDPFLVFYRSNEDGTFTICHKTEVVKNTLNPVWQPFSIPVRALCNGDYDRTVKIDVYDWDRDGSHDFIGEFTTSYRELSKAQNQFTVYEVTLLSFSVDSEFTFVDYIKGGTQLNFTVAIDFTASNGNPLQPTSLHYMSPYQLSAYAMALKAVGEIIQDYDSDKLFPAYGFGAKLPPEGRISHQFPLNNNDEDPNCAGIEGVLESYFQSLRTVQLYGPTYFAPVINQVARAAAKISDGSQYYVLLIITDGVISDMTQTKEAIVSASSLPMSIIIVGVGPAMFEAMEELDGDDVRVSSRGRYAERDIVQFVPFRDYVDRSGNQVLSMARLAKDVLAEIPEQLLSYMRTRDIQPRPPPPVNPSPTPAPEQP
uniref:copine-9 isoform X3 n=1 Tax=Callithrix jacchus TaxID=9483 RepID=UPI0023DD394F|nr:copine-9 isoform X3 [Callithrix jacchus]